MYTAISSSSSGAEVLYEKRNRGPSNSTLDLCFRGVDVVWSAMAVERLKLSNEMDLLVNGALCFLIFKPNIVTLQTMSIH
jgi:hypothetical protein